MVASTEVEANELTDEAVGYLQELLRFDTTNPPGNETAAAAYIAGLLEGAGYKVALIESSPGRGNVVARYGGTGERKPLLLYCHLDVVTAEPQRWSHHPFSGDIADGCVWGRGAVDMKGMVAQELMVMLLLARNKVALKRDVIFAATADEEVGGRAGMGFLVDNHPDLIEAEYGLSEGGGSTMYIGGKPFYDVRTAEKGTCRFKVRAHGSPGHASVPREKTAVAKLAEAVVKISTATFPFSPTPTVVSLCEALTEAVNVPAGDGPLNEEQFYRLLEKLPTDFAQYLLAVTRDTAVPTILEAGTKVNVIPSEAEALVDGRYLPGRSAEAYLREIRGIVGEGYEIEPIDVTLPLEGSTDNPLYGTIEETLARHAPEAGILPITLAGATDAKHVTRMGTRCLGFSPVKIGEGFPIEQLVHGHDERIPVDGFSWGIRVLYDIVSEFCG